MRGVDSDDIAHGMPSETSQPGSLLSENNDQNTQTVASFGQAVKNVMWQNLGR